MRCCLWDQYLLSICQGNEVDVGCFIRNNSSFVVMDDVFIWRRCIICNVHRTFCLLKCREFSLLLWCKADNTSNSVFSLLRAVKGFFVWVSGLLNERNSVHIADYFWFARWSWNEQKLLFSCGNVDYCELLWWIVAVFSSSLTVGLSCNSKLIS